ncbi:MAG: AsmA family protein [Mariniphaga sp.]
MMKKILVLSCIFISLLIGAMGVIPLLFKDTIVQKVKIAANESLLAKVDFSEVGLSLFRSFPQLNIQLKQLSVTGINEFENIRLLSVESVSTSVNLSGLWKSDGFSITSIRLDHPQINLVVNKAGKSNWDITGKKAGQADNTDQKSTQINLKKIQIRNASLTFLDETAPMLFSLRNGTFDLSGAMTGNNSRLNITGEADSINFEYNGSRVASNFKATLKGGLQSDFDKMSFTFLQNELRINQLPLEVQGTFVLGKKDYNFDITYKSPASSLTDLLGFIPAQYQKNLKGIEAKGEIAFNGFVKGIYSDTTFPAFGVDLKIDGGRLKYPELPKEIEKIELTANISKPQGPLDLTKIDLEKFNASIAGNPISATLHIATPVSDPMLKGNIKGRIDFASLKQAIPMDAIDLKGIIDASVEFAGQYSAIEKEQYENFRTDGTISLKDFMFASKELTQKVEIRTADIRFSPKSIALNNLSGNMGESNFTANGSLTNYWAYILKKGVLNGILSVNSSYININQLIPNSTAKDTLATGHPFEVPDNINFTLQSTVQKALYDKMNITEITGKMGIKERKVILEGLNMKMLSGKLLVSGSYFTPKSELPDFDFKMDIKDFDLPTAYQSISTIRHFLPLAAGSTGAFSSGLTLKGKLGNDYSPVFSTLNGDGVLAAKNIQLAETGLFDEIGKYFRKDLFKQVKVNDFTTNFRIVGGGLIIAPFNTKIAGQDVTIAGRQSVTKNIDYRIDFKVNKADISEEVTKYIGFVPGAENISKYPIGINLGGTFDKPDVKVDLTEAKKLVEAEFKKKAGSTIQEAIKKFGLDKLFK